MFSKKNKQPVIKLDSITQEETASDCEELRELFSNLSVDDQAIYLKLFKATVGAVTHLAYDRAKEVDLGCMWKMVNDDGLIYLTKVVSNARQVYDLEELNNAELGSYVFQTYKIKIQQGLDKLAVSVQTNAGITDSFNVTKPERLGYLIKMSIGRLNK